MAWDQWEKYAAELHPGIKARNAPTRRNESEVRNRCDLLVLYDIIGARMGIK